jgi:hypothetical protein
MAELTPEQILHRAKAVEAFMNSDAWTEVQERMEDKAFKAFRAKTSTPEQREALWQKWQAFEEIASVFRAIRDRQLAIPEQEQ